MATFHKMHGLGNDFVVIDARVATIAMTPARARAIADRHTGIGCDQLIVLEPAAGADATMRIWNHDGSEVGACGNAARAVALLIGNAVLATRGGRIAVRAGGGGAAVDMGQPRFGWDDIPDRLCGRRRRAAGGVGWAREARRGQRRQPTSGVLRRRRYRDRPRAAGAADRNDPLFPERINVNIAQVTGPQAVTMRTWERGAGLTRACGTGACAVAVMALRARLVTGPVAVSLPGGALTIDWQAGGTITMTGPATHVFTGDADWSRFG